MEWTHDMPPEDHPMWEEQVNLEREMLKAGADRFRDRVITAMDKQNVNRLAPIKATMESWLPQVADGFKQWVQDHKKSKGVKPIALKVIQETDPGMLAAVSVRTLLNLIATKKVSLLSLVNELGRTVEHELKVREWEAKEKGLFVAQQKDFKKNKSTGVHQRRVNILQFNKLLNDPESKVSWEPWTNELSQRVGITMLDVTMRVTGWFELTNDPEHEFQKGSYPKLTVAPKPEFMEIISKRLEQHESSCADYMPCVMPPKRWTSTKQGGYWTPYVRAPRLIRFKAHQEHQKMRAQDEYDALDLTEELDAIHTLQETPWRVNKVVLETALKVWAMGDGVAKLPHPSEEELPPRTPRMVDHGLLKFEHKSRGEKPPAPDEETLREIKEWRRKAAPIYQRNVTRVSVTRATTETLKIAQRYKDYEEIYFPHMLDFRARKYPVANYLNPQGNELSRGLLEYAGGLPVDEQSAGWIAVHLASVWGHDKVPFDERIQWVEERRELWERIAADPTGNLEWTKADKPFQSLAAVLSWADYLREGSGYVSRLPIMVDGTCNGIQHLSALTLDETSGFYVNLVPSERPQDIYGFCAGHVDERLRDDELAGGSNATLARYWQRLTNGKTPRDATKRQVMVLPYGGTLESYFTYTRLWLDERDPIPEWVSELPDDARRDWFAERTSRVVYFAKVLWEIVGDVASGAVTVMKWLQDCAKAAAIANQPIYWVVPTGFVVRHFYGLNRDTRIKMTLDGEVYKLLQKERTAKLSVKEQLQGIAPNFVHSLDAAALTRCIKLAKEAGITTISAIHDAYGTHAANMWPLFKILRQAFVEIHKAEPLEAFRAACKEVIEAVHLDAGLSQREAEDLAERSLPKPLKKGTLDLDLVLESDYFFA